METSTEKTSDDTSRSSTPEKKHYLEFFITCAMMNNQIPDFWPDQPREWFIKFEAFMNIQNQNDEYKYNIAITKLKNDEAIHAITDIIMIPPRTGKYEALKKVLLNVFFFTKEKKLEKITKVLESSQSMTSGMVEQNILLRRIEKSLSDLCEMLQPDDDRSSSDGLRKVWNSRSWQCWYHWRFGANSTKCADEIRCTFGSVLNN